MVIKKNLSSDGCGQLERRGQTDFGPDLDASTFTANDVVALNDSGDTNGVNTLVMPLIDPDDAAMGAHEDFAAARDFGGQSQGEIDFCTRRQLFMSREVNAACRDVSGLALVSARFSIDGDSNIHR